MVQLIFILLYIGDAVLSMLSFLAPAFTDFSELVSALLFIIAVVVLVMSIAGKCEPRSVFLTLSAYYVGVGAALVAIMFVLVEDTSIMEDPEAMRAFFESFSWWVPAMWTVTVIQLALGIYGAKNYSSH